MPGSKKEAALDTCRCPIWCRGYLAKEVETVDGVAKPKRVRASLGCVDWACATTEVAKLYKHGALPSVQTTKGEDTSAKTVTYAVERYLKSRTEPSADPLGKDSYDHYKSLLEQRLSPYCAADETKYTYCAAEEIVYIRAFENTDECNKFVESWRQLRRNVGTMLEMSTRKTELARFRTFLDFCVTNDWIKKNGAKKVKVKKGKTAEETERYGLELYEYRQMLQANGSPALTDLENQETRVATELMRWCGLRISDAHKFNEAEIVKNESKDGWNARFIMKKTELRCEVSLPDHVYDQLMALPGRVEDGKKYFFTCEYSALRERVDTLATRALRIPSDADHHSKLMPITIPK